MIKHFVCNEEATGLNPVGSLMFNLKIKNMTVKIIKFKKGGYAYSVSLIEGSPLWIYKSNEECPNPTLPTGRWEDTHFTVWHFLTCQYRPNKNRWFVQAIKEDFGRTWVFKLLV